MAMVGQTQSRVHRRYKPQSNRWMTPPPKKRNSEDIWFYIQAAVGTIAVMVIFFLVWWNCY